MINTYSLTHGRTASNSLGSDIILNQLLFYNVELATSFMHAFYCSSCTFRGRYFRGFTALRSLGILIKTFQCVCLLYKMDETKA